MHKIALDGACIKRKERETDQKNNCMLSNKKYKSRGRQTERWEDNFKKVAGPEWFLAVKVTTQQET